LLKSFEAALKLWRTLARELRSEGFSISHGAFCSIPLIAN